MTKIPKLKLKYHLLAVIVLVFLACETAGVNFYCPPKDSSGICADSLTAPFVSAKNVPASGRSCYTCSGTGKKKVYCLKILTDTIEFSPGDPNHFLAMVGHNSRSVPGPMLIASLLDISI
ncbi:hypothetical protein CROQUDRAFT_103292 [Cronartium quercuum f. sp. fusiforme G11]|uniref:Uncharacterized protein n=1 Tax=Cronartium quercuum f. sp. fusiforme G11 TaxID=708437 RepID=A0A9P6NRA8_9BASI|nr:hypothetical protein CROQUDRAFT_103292 [Cronartium quercuum f. sp. fusiforme G11]